jgi:hypothetical protein
MTKKEAKFILDSLTETHSILGEQLTSWGPNDDPDFQCHSKEDGPYTGDLTYHFTMGLMQMVRDGYPEGKKIKRYKEWYARLEEWEAL